jgi:hypothetical protein
MAILTTGNTFVNGDQVTALKLNDAVNLAAFTSGAVDAVTTVLSSGAVSVKDGGITAAKIGSGAVTEAKLEAGTNGQLFIGKTSISGFTKGTLTAGSDMTITNGSGTITIAATAPSTLSSISAANTYAGTLNTDLVLGTGNGFAGVTLTVGKWLVTGSVTIRSSTGTTIRLIPVFWDGTTEYSCSTGVESGDLSVRFCVPASAIMTVSSGTRSIVYKIKTSGAGETIDAGTAFGSSSVITAVRLTETP